MSAPQQSKTRAGLVWGVISIASAAALYLAATSPLLEWRDPIYIIAGLSGIVALIFLGMQPLLAKGMVPAMALATSRRLHRWLGIGVLAAVIIHVGALWITSPPDVIDALLLRSPTPFSIWGVTAMWAVFATALLAAFRKRLKLSWLSWRIAHSLLAVLIVGGTVLHALLIEGTMETLSKIVLCVLVGLATFSVLADRNVLTRLRKSRR